MGKGVYGMRMKKEVTKIMTHTIEKMKDHQGIQVEPKITRVIPGKLVYLAAIYMTRQKVLPWAWQSIWLVAYWKQGLILRLSWLLKNSPAVAIHLPLSKCTLTLLLQSKFLVKHYILTLINVSKGLLPVLSFFLDETRKYQKGYILVFGLMQDVLIKSKTFSCWYKSVTNPVSRLHTVQWQGHIDKPVPWQHSHHYPAW